MSRRPEPSARRPGANAKTKILALSSAIVLILISLLSSLYGPNRSEGVGEVVAFVSPDSSFQAVSEALDGVSTRIYLAMYDFTSLPLLDKMSEAAKSGAEVKVLLEWNVIEAREERDKKLELCYHLDRAGAEVRFLVEKDYRLFHAKYAILDSEVVLVTSDNWVENGLPQDPSYGNRGWGVSIKDAPFARDLEKVFLAEWESGTCDWIDEIDEEKISTEFHFGPVQGGYDPIFAPFAYDLESEPEVFFSPFMDWNPVIEQIHSATESVYVEQQTLKLERDESPYSEALKSAAMRGCEVKVLLDGSSYNALENQRSADQLNGWAIEYGLDLEAKLFDHGPLRMLHNKGMVIDGDRVIISSMNWNTACKINRDISIVLEGEVASYFETAFLYDWGLKWDYHIKMDMCHDNRGIYSFEEMRRKLWLESIHCKIVPVWELDSDVFVITDPRRDLLDGELRLLKEFVEEGGKVVMTSYNSSDSHYQNLNLVLKELNCTMRFSDRAFYGYIYTWLNEEKISMLRPRAIEPGGGMTLCGWKYGVLGASEGDIYLLGSSFFLDPYNLMGTLAFFSSLLRGSVL